MSASPVTAIRVRLFGTPAAMVQTTVLEFRPTLEIFDFVCSQIAPTAKVSVTRAFADEFFDLSNNPARDDQRAKVWSGRSLSAGDALELDFADDTTMLAVCLPVGWFIGSMQDATLPGALDGTTPTEFLKELEAAPTSLDRYDVCSALKPMAQIS